MSKGLLSDQMGAMALVDELRHRRMEVEEHLDLPRREAEVAERIRAYYKSQGIDCDDELVAQGVREFFTHRLVFEAPPMNWRQRFLGRLIISNTFRLWMVAMLAFAITFGMSFHDAYLKTHAPHTPAEVAMPPAAPIASHAGSTPEQALARFQQLHDRYFALPLSLADRQRAQQNMDYLRETASLGGAQADSTLDEFELQVNFIAPTLRLEVSRLPDGKTGVEVCKQDDGCQATTRYIFVRAMDDNDHAVDFFANNPDGHVVPLPAMGVEVSQAQYLKFKQEMHDNGSIAKPTLGTSPAANARMFFDDRVVAKPRYLRPEKLNQVTLLDSF